MSTTESMPRLRQYLRERGWKDIPAPAYDWIMQTDKGSVAVRGQRILATCVHPGDYRVKTHRKEQSAIDWLEENYPKA